MALVWIREQAGGRSGSGDEKAVRLYTRRWKVLRDSMLDDAYAVLSSPGLPRIFDVYVGADGVPDPLAALCAKLEATQPDADQPFLWEVVAHYSNRVDWPSLGDVNPLLRPTEISGDYDRFQIPLVVDLNGVPVLNSAGEKFDPPVEVDDSRNRLTLQRNELGDPTNTFLVYKDAINSDTWLGQKPKTWKLSGKFQRAYENGLFFWRTTYDVHFNPKTWASQVLDQGTKFIDHTGLLRPFKLRDGSYSTTLLNGEGGPLGYADGVNAGAVGVLTYAVGAADTAITANVGGATNITWPLLASTYNNGYVIVKIDNEYVLLTGPMGGGQTWTGCIRGWNGTVAAAHAASAAVVMQPYYLSFSPYVALPFAALNLP